MRVTLCFLFNLLAAGGALATAPDGVPLRRPDLAGEARESRDKPREANAFFRENRLPPGATRFPAEKLLAAREHARRMQLHSARANAYLDTGEAGAAEAQALIWTALGPGNVGGRTRALRISPSSPATMYAAGVAGGVWKSTNSGASWTPKGDLLANLAVSALALDPTNANVLYAGTGEGYFNFDDIQGAGVFKSTDGGNTWTQLAATAPPGSADFLFVNDLVVSANNHNVVYAATGTGLWRSTNAGSSWTRQIDAASANGCMDIALRPALNPDTVIVSCGTFAPTDSKSGIWRSTNANVTATTWSHRLGAPGSGAAVTRANMGRTSLAIAPSLGATQYALIACSATTANSCGAGNAFDDGLLALYKSTDGGLTWGARYDSSFDAGTLSDLLLTNPVAQLCEGIGGFNQGWYDNVIAVDPTNAERVFVGGIDVFRSDNGGLSFGTISYWWLPNDLDNYAHADHHALVFHPNYNGTTERRLYVGNDGGLAVSTDAGTATRATTFASVCPENTGDLEGATWTGLNNGYAVTQSYHGTPYPSGTRYIAGTQDNGTLRGSDSGGANAWSEINGGDGGYTAINPNTSGASTVLYVENTGISIRRSSNDGNSFSDTIDGILDPDCGRFINPFVMDPNNPARLYTSHNAIWRTSTSASSWQQASAKLPGTSCVDDDADSGERFSALAIADGDPNLLVAGTNRGRLCRLTNADGSSAGSALQNCSTPAGTAVVSGVAFDPNDPSRVYASFSTIEVLPLWRSTNSGQTWTSVSGSGATGLPNVGAHSIAVSPYDRDTIYVGTDVGVFVTTDGGATWARENTGFANVRTDRLVFNAVGAQQAQLFAFTHGRGTFRTTVPFVPPLADLSISKTDGVASVKAGAQVTYTIVVSNPAAKTVEDVTVSDAFPPALGACSWTCTDSPGSACDPSGSGAIDDTVTIAAGGSVSYSATCTLSASASGTLANTATVSYANDPVAGNNTATDSDAIVPQANVAIAKSDGTASVEAGATVVYSIVASNPAAAAITGVGVADAFPAVLSGCTWTCSASSGGSCPASGNGNIAATVALGAGGAATFTASCTLAASATGTLANTATVTYANDPVAANNTATDTDTIVPRADVSVSKSDGATVVLPGSTRVYTIVVDNPSANPVSPVTVSDAFPAALTGCAWTCAADPGSVCPSNGNGAIAAQVTLGASAAVTFTATCTLAPDATGTVANTASASYANDPNPANDAATDTDTVSDQLIFADDFE